MARIVSLPRQSMPPALTPASPAMPERRLSGPRLSAVGNKATLLQLVRARMAEGLRLRPACEWVAGQLAAEMLPRIYLDASTALAKRGCRHVSAASLMRWADIASDHDVINLAGNYHGRARGTYPWEPKAAQYYRLPSQPYPATIAIWLVEDDGFDPATCNEGLVRRFLRGLPTDHAEFHGDRIGHHNRTQNFKPYKIRDASVLDVGMVWEGDGHSLHYYIRHPNTGRHFHAELSVWIDVRSQYIVGWWLGEAESVVQTLYSLTHAITSQNHVPSLLHVDPGPGYKNRALGDAVAGFAPRIGTDFSFALPGNAKGKGLQEGWFRWFEERHGSKQDSYTGPERPQEHLRRLEKRIERGEMYIPAFDEAKADIATAIDKYQKRNKEGLGTSPAALHEKLERNPLIVSPSILMRPRETRTARRYGVQMFNRLYRAPALASYEQREVQVEYDLHDDRRVWIFDLKGRFVTEAVKVESTPWLPESRIEELRQKREQGRLRRLERHAEEIRAQSRTPITADQALAELSSLDAEAELPENEIEGLPPLDLYDTDY